MRFTTKEAGDSFNREVNRIYNECYPPLSENDLAGLSEEQAECIRFTEKIEEIRRKEKIANILFFYDSIPSIDIIKAMLEK